MSNLKKQGSGIDGGQWKQNSEMLPIELRKPTGGDTDGKQGWGGM